MSLSVANSLESLKAIAKSNIGFAERRVRWPTHGRATNLRLVRYLLMRHRKAAETDAERRERIDRLERQIESWLARVWAELKERRERERATGLD